MIKSNRSKFKTKDLCWALDFPKASFYRLTNKKTVKIQKTKSPNKRKVTEKEKHRALNLLNNVENIDKSPRQVFYEYLDSGEYICSLASFYRILNENGASCERRKIRKHRNYSRPELIATGPNQVWSWDVSKLKGPIKFSYFYLYTIIDIYSKLVIGWTIAERETSDIAKEMFLKSFKRQGIRPDLLIVHSDRGPIMKSDCLAKLYCDLGIERSLNRPYVSNDNPFSEANFKTLKYRPDYPDRFLSLNDADKYLDLFYKWYNKKHYHSGIKMLTPASVHYGNQNETVSKRNMIMEKAKQKNPERFFGKKKSYGTFKEPVYINKPVENVT